ncbi:T9SS type A sorting domain-containing protein [Hymenobacter metallicola]|uniref:T9SS type A sorting domain-containing protein n=1 Tax=Hymenobacter metallicola TaxID=2563114 RepID=A0A4Z0QJW2_9BACT|nr:T9SS type A sorting domain-containing protein [Hymenobacter metallicola]TGE28992.1 T9SS type A sorting domain-containing protein [Hymenobacter metallicola]
MKKQLLTLALLSGLGIAPQAQAQWVLQNTATPSTPGNLISDLMHTVSEQVAWQLMSPNTTNSPSRALSKTANGGATWEYKAIRGNSSFQAAGIHALDENTAFVSQFGSPGGEILKTTDGGTTWTKVTLGGEFTSASSFANWVYFFDANNGVTLGDPTPDGVFEVYTTSNGGRNWTRVPAANLPTPLDELEYGLTGSYCALGNTIWAGTSNGDNGVPVRVLKSTDRGLTWTASELTPLVGAITKIAMSDANNGIAFNDSDLIYTTDGGNTWQSQFYTGNFNHNDLAHVPGTNIIVSVGTSVPTPSGPNDYGSSYTTDNGATWIDIDRGREHRTVDFASRTAGYTGAVTSASGTGGVYKASATILSTARNSELQKALAVYPNPSSSGVFELQLRSGIKAGTSVRVFDALGRQVLNQHLNATAVASQVAPIDLSKQKAGLYTLELRTSAGVAQQKLVIQ